VGSRDEDGYITYVGRGDDVFKASDYRISPFALESVLIEHPAVAEAVVPSPDPVISGKIRRVELRGQEERRGTDRKPGEFWEEDLPELKS
jgi:acetyl-CoA synthetase